MEIKRPKQIYGKKVLPSAKVLPKGKEVDNDIIGLIAFITFFIFLISLLLTIVFVCLAIPILLIMGY